MGGVMPQYEIVAHIVRDVDAATVEDAAALAGHDLREALGTTGMIRHLAVWRHDPAAASPLPAAARQQLIDFFAELARCADAAESEFRDRVAAIFATPTMEPEASIPGAEPARSGDSAL
ncbi:MAG TPA: hypothetical protein VFI22_14250 [Thermomicrobiales bacterium]|nr:hypothetical protein [Thermomicrobiales bacterium]